MLNLLILALKKKYLLEILSVIRISRYALICCMLSTFIELKKVDA
jgi:hypothetical protein